MSYVDGFLLPVPRKNLAAYKKMATLGKKMWLEHGALDYKECVGDDLEAAWALPFPKQMKLKKGEVPVFSFIVFKNRKHRDAVNKKVMANMPEMSKKMPFDVKRMAYGGFAVLVE
jgi:uncharacterized protein YbaA (DUF1428 family)